MTPHVLSVDVGGTKVDVCRVDGTLSVETAERFSSTELGKGSMAFMDRLKGLLAERMGSMTRGIAVSFNCSLQDGVCVWSSVLGGEVRYPIERDLRDTFGVPVAADDDIHAMTLAEATLGAAPRYGSFAMVNIGTGIGVGYHEGTVVRGARNNAGLIGQRPTYVPELGETRHLDRVVSGRGISEMYAAFGGATASAAEVFDRIGHDPLADRTIEVFTRHLGDVLVDVMQFYDPAFMVISGSVSLAAPAYLHSAWRRLQSLVEPAFHPRGVAVSEVDHAAPRGAALILCQRVPGIFAQGAAIRG